MFGGRVAGSTTLGRMPTGTLRMAGSGAGASGGAALQRPVAPDLVANATSAAVAAASSAVDLSCMEIDVVAVGMGLRFVEIQTDEKVQTLCTKWLCPWSADWPDISTGV